MSGKDFHEGPINQCDGNEEAVNTKQVFHRVGRCPACGEDDLGLFDFGVFLSSDFLGMTRDGEMGCGRVEMDGDYEYVVMCRSCEHRASAEPSVTKETLLEWAVAEGQEVQTLDFICPLCGSVCLSEHTDKVEMYQEVVAVYTVKGDNGEEQAEVALSPYRNIFHCSAPRYRCLNGHELAKDDGTPVATAEDLVAWLKTHSERK